MASGGVEPGPHDRALSHPLGRITPVLKRSQRPHRGKETLRTMKRASVRTLSIFIMCAALVSGCGFLARFGLDKQVAKVEEAKQKAVQAEASRFAATQYRLA